MPNDLADRSAADVRAEVDRVLGAATDDEWRPPRLVPLGEASTAPPHWLVPQLLLGADVNLFAGEGDAGKSTVAYHVLGAVAVGAPVFAARPTTATPVGIFTSGEDDEGIVRNRLEAFARGHGWPLPQLHAHVHVNADGQLNLDDPACIDWLTQAVRTRGLGLVLFDPLADLLGADVDENSNSDARRIVRALRQLVLATGTTVLISHHVTKPAEGREQRHRVRGASGWLNATRMSWFVERLDAGMLLTPIKANRLGTRTPLTVTRSVEVADPLDAITWTSARLTVAETGGHGALQQHVHTVLRVLDEAARALSTNDFKYRATQAGLSKDKAMDALSEARHRGWAAMATGENRSKNFAITEAGRAQLLLG